MSDIATAVAGNEGLGVRGGTEVNAALGVVASCNTHKRFRGLRRPRNGCPKCNAVYTFVKGSGVKERRYRRANRDERDGN